MRRFHVLRLLTAVAAALMLSGAASSQVPLGFPDGAMSGDVTDTRAVIWTRTPGPATVRVEYATTAALGGPTSEAVQTAAASDFTAKIDLSGLRPSTRYYYRAVASSGDRRAAGLVGSFKTAPAASEVAGITLAWGADVSERFKPFRIFDAIRIKEPDFFLFLGDTIYADLDANARTIDEYRGAYRRNRDDEAFQKFTRATSIDAIWDDHEVANNFDRTHARLPVGRAAFLEYWPVRPDAADPHRLYRAARWGKLLEVFILDARQYRSPEFDRDTAHKTLLGASQKGWLNRRLLASGATFKVIVTTVPLKYHGVDSWEGYVAERQELFGFIAHNNIKGVVFLSGDVHYAAVLRYKEGFVEAIAGPLAQFINRRRPAAGEPETEFASNRSFTFGLVRITASPPALAIELYDVDGRLLHRTSVEP